MRGDPRFERIVASLAPEEWGAYAETETDFADGFAAEKVTEVPRIQSQQHIRPRERAEKNGTIFVALKMGSGQQIGTCTSFFRELRSALSVEESVPRNILRKKRN